MTTYTPQTFNFIPFIMSHSINTEILENLYEEILNELSFKNIQLGIMLPMHKLEEIAADHAQKRFEELG